MKSILVTGDATERTEDKILEFHEDEWLRSEVYKIPHHGSSTTSEDQALRVAAQPLRAIFFRLSIFLLASWVSLLMEFLPCLAAS